MKNKLYSSFVAFALLLAGNLTKAQVVVVQSGANASVYSNLDDAIDAASPGDYLYLSGDLFLVHGHQTGSSDSMHFGKPLHFVGAGINADSTSVTRQTRIQSAPTSSNLDGHLTIGSAAGGSTFDGIIFSGSGVFFQNGLVIPDSSGHFSFNRCQMNQCNLGAVGGGPAPGTLSVELHECILTGGLLNAGTGISSAAIDRCIVMSLAQSASAAVTWINCVLASAPGAGTINNCIIYASNNSFANQFSAVYNNCILGDAQPGSGSDVFNNCSFNATMSNVFVNAATPGFVWSNDYHLANGSPAIGFGNDGHDAGIYGSATPTKPGYVPYNPHFTGATIPASTDANGNLNINIRVAAQTY